MHSAVKLLAGQESESLNYIATFHANFALSMYGWYRLSLSPCVNILLWLAQNCSGIASTLFIFGTHCKGWNTGGMMESISQSMTSFAHTYIAIWVGSCTHQKEKVQGMTRGVLYITVTA